jgi:hypothetical protein
MPRSPSKTRRRAPATSLALAGRHRLEVEKARASDTIRVLDRSGTVALTVRVTPGGLSICVESGALTLQSSGTLRVDADRLELRGRSGVSIESEGDAALAVAGDLTVRASSQELRATLGDVRLAANDDVKVDGERILLNSEPQGGPRDPPG